MIFRINWPAGMATPKFHIEWNSSGSAPAAKPLEHTGQDAMLRRVGRSSYYLQPGSHESAIGPQFTT